MNVPITLNAIGVGVELGAVVGTQVVVAAGRGVNVGVGVLVGFGVCVAEGFGVGVNVGETGAPDEITIASSEKPGPGVGEVPELPPLLQLSIIAPKTNNRTGATTSHLSHRENIKL